MLRYLKDSLTQGLHIKPSERLRLTSYSDVNWAFFIDDKRCVAGYCVYFDDSLVSWSTKKQHVIARSRIELEYRAFAQVVAKIVYNLFFKN